MTGGIDGLREYFRRIDSVSDDRTKRQIMGTLGLLGVVEAKKLELPHRKTGNLGRTIRLGEVTPSSVDIVAGGQGFVGYARILEEGSRPHTILPRNRKALRWAVGGNRRLSGSPRSGAPVIFARSVRHPGTRPYPYLFPGAREALRIADLDALIITAWNRAA